MAPYRPNAKPSRKSYSRSPPSALKSIKRSPVRFRPTSAPRSALRNSSTFYRRKQFDLAPIHEESPRRRSRHSSTHRDTTFHLFDHDQGERSYRQEREDSDNEDPQEDPPLFPWEDEKTLVSDLMHEGAKDDQSEDDKLCTLIESLQTPFSQQSKELLGDVADTLVPAVNSVKRAYHALNEESDVTYGSGLLLIDEACKKVEAVTIRQQDAVTDEYQASQTRIKELFTQLKEAYDARDQLWVDFENDLDEIFDPVQEAFKNLPAELERTLAHCEKQSKKITKDKGGTEKMLKDLLSTLG